MSVLKTILKKLFGPTAFAEEIDAFRKTVADTDIHTYAAWTVWYHQYQYFYHSYNRNRTSELNAMSRLQNVMKCKMDILGDILDHQHQQKVQELIDAATKAEGLINKTK